MSDVKTLYHRDFVLWSKEQAEALRSAAHGGSNQSLDWENLAEEIESLGISQLRELKSQIRRVIEHLLKLENSRAIEPRRGWIETINDARVEIEAVIEDSPSLHNEVSAAVIAEMKRASRKAIHDLEKYHDVEPAIVARIHSATYMEDQILGDWFPPDSADAR
ncbi:MAG: DUF29 domain-containing protein [Alphaproteobacteria bacterium]|nr:DUF29 domain-containing protein [Alphaproteobacteria bacterium]